MAAPRTDFARLLLLSVLTVSTVHGVRPIATYRALDLGAGPFEIGLLPAAFAVLSLFVAVPAGRWVDRLGEDWFLVAGTATLGLGSLSILLIDSIPLLIASQAILGLGHILNLVSGQTMVANRSRREARDQRFGYYSVAASLGQLIGPSLAGLLAGQSVVVDEATGALATDNVFLAGGVAGGAAMLIALTLVRRGGERRGASQTTTAQQGTFRTAGKVLRQPTMVPAMIASVAVILSVDLLVAYLPAYGEAQGISVQVVGMLLSVRAGCSLASRLAMAPLIRRLGRGNLLSGSMVLACVGLLAFLFVDSVVVLVGLMVLVGLGLGFGQPITVSWVASQSSRELRGTALGVRHAGNRLGQLFVPALVGLVASTVGLAAVFWAMSLLLGLGAGLVLRTPFDVDIDPDAKADPG